MNITIISGSARANNNTIRVARALKLRMENTGHHVSLVDFMQYDIPLVAQGPVNSTLTPFQQHLTDSMLRAQAIIIITPEYNWSTTPEILNFLHRFGDDRFKELFEHKVFASVGVSTGRGGKAPAIHINNILSKIISYMDLTSVISAKIFESHFTKEVLDDAGHSLGNEKYDAGLNDFIDYTLRITQKWNQQAITIS